MKDKAATPRLGVAIAAAALVALFVYTAVRPPVALATSARPSGQSVIQRAFPGSDLPLTLARFFPATNGHSTPVPIAQMLLVVHPLVAPAPLLSGSELRLCAAGSNSLFCVGRGGSCGWWYLQCCAGLVCQPASARAFCE